MKPLDENILLIVMFLCAPVVIDQIKRLDFWGEISTIEERQCDVIHANAPRPDLKCGEFNPPRLYFHG
jgi:hypothetical protein